VRWKWTPGSIDFWDNRVVVHRAVPGGYDPSSREGKRTAIFGERPFFDPDISESLTERKERLRREEAGEAEVLRQEGKANGGELNGAYSNDVQKLDFAKLNVV
jgi:sulfonate dioxygenase